MRRLVRLAGRAPGARALAATPAGRRLVRAMQGALLVDSPARFARRELRRAGIGAYAPRGSSQRVHVRHGTADLDILYELWRLRMYEPHAVVETALGPQGPARIADLGAHVGMFGAWARDRWPRCEIDAFEPDPGSAAVHRLTIAANPGGGPWRLHEAAAGTAPGEARFAAGRGPASRVDEDAAGAVAVPVRDVFGVLAGADLLKIDIEGSEWALLQDARFADLPARAVALEYHDTGAPAGEGARESAHRLLREAGFQTREIPGAPAGAGMLWGWRDG